jgi:tetratricopeptide (TPR) repeat protein
LWALNPVGVYAVAYLVQRSILMAGLFVVMACLCFVKGLKDHNKLWFAAAFVSYVLALVSKEFAITAVALLLPLYIYIQRPSLQRSLGVLAISVGVALIGGYILYIRYAGVLGNLFDENSVAFAQQLERQTPGVGQHLFALSIQNQASLFFHYGAMWLLPYVGWMSIDLRPTFPVSLWSWHTLGLVGYIITLALGLWAVLKRQDAWGLLGLSVLIPGLLFMTEFGTIWLQDPFVLYRSYLWSWTVPVILACLWMLASAGFARKTLYIAGGLVALVWCALTWERIDSLSTPRDAWADATRKINLNAPANAVGRWRPMINLGTELMELGLYDEALRQFSQADSLGEPLGSARMNMGVALQQLRQHPQAIDSFDKAEAKGFTEGALYYHRGESQFALRRLDDAYQSLTHALSKTLSPEVRLASLARRAEAAVAQQKPTLAITDYQELLKLRPDGQRYQIGLAMALMGQKDFAGALAVLNKAIDARPTVQLYYARALTYFNQGNANASRQDLAQVLKAEPQNPVYLGLAQRLQTPPGAPAKVAKP